jgi:hypothetical protein
MKKNKSSTSKGLQKPREILLPIGNRLSESIQFLPSGIIDKTYTGIGGTSLELDCERNSIIVVPYNNIADIKASQPTIGNSFKVHKFKKNRKNSKLKSDLDDYIKHTKEKCHPIKIICVNDQLVHLRSELTSASIDFKSMFLLFDEIDSMQEQSSFRSVMDTCMEVYLDHPETQRAMISATISNFSHPGITKELKSKIVSPRRKQTAIGFIHTNNVILEAFAQVKKLVSNDDSKIVIACNHLKSALVLAKTLKKEFPKKNIGILCSSTSKSKKAAENFFQKLGMDGILPCQINIITAAYFNGCDIHEKYHSIILSTISQASLQLSPSTIYQISGRGRMGLLSNLLIARTGYRKDGYKIYLKNELIDFASHSVDIREGLKKMTEKVSSLGEDLMHAIHGLLVEGSKELPALYRYLEHGTVEVSYFKIDQRLIEQMTVSLMAKSIVYQNSLKEYFDLSEETELHTKLNGSLEKIDKKTVIDSIFKDLYSLLSSNNYKLTSNKLFGLKDSYSPYGLQEFKLIVNVLELAISNKLDLDKLYTQIHGLNGNSKFLIELRNLYCLLLWNTLSEDINLKKALTWKIKANSGYQMKQMKALEMETADYLDINKKLVSKKFTQFKELIKMNPTLLRKAIFDTEETTQRVDGKGTRLIKVKGFRSSTHQF